MKNFLLATLMLVTLGVQAAPEARVYEYPVTRVKDGDTVEFEAKWLPAPLKPVLSLRVLGVDTPEKAPRAKCASEAERGERATAFTKQAIQNARRIEIELVSWDTFGGRVLGDVIIDGKHRLSQLLIDNQLARPYHGEAKTSWCN